MIGTSKSVWGFDPRTIPGCQLWLDPANSSSLTLSGANVVTIADSSTTGATATRLAGNSYATTTTISGNRILSFSSENIVYRSPMVLTGAAYTIFVIGSLLSGSGYQRIVNTDGSGGRIFIGANNGSFITFTGNNNFNDTGVNTPDYTLTGAGLQLMSIVVSGSSLIPYINGTAMNTKTGTTGATTVLDIGAYEDGVTQAWNGYIGDIIVYNSALTSSQRQQVEGYLAHKWGLVPPPPTTPLTIPGCQLWLDAADSSTVTGTTNVTQWRDKSGNARHFGVRVGGTTYSSNAINLNSSCMFVDSLVDLTKVTLFIVTKSTGGNNQTVFTARPNTGTSYNSTDGFGFYMNGTTSMQFFGTYPASSSFAIDTSTPKLFSFQSSGTSISAWYNGISQVGSTLSSARTSTARGFGIGGEWTNENGGGYQNFYVNVSIYEIIVFNSDVNTSQRQTIEGYLSRKWGIGSSSIPSTHPFYSIRPHLRAFQPIDVPGCQLWLDAADQSSMTLSGSNVTQWSDKSGNGNTVIQATSANQPTYVTNVVNGNPVLRFNGTSHVLQTTSFTSLGTNSVSFWLVERNLSNSGGGGAPFSFNSGPNNGIVFQNNNGLQPLPTSVPYTSSVARIVFYNRTNTGSGDSGYLNGTVVSIRDDNTTGTYGTTFAVGMRILSTIYTSGDICEILIFIGMPTVSQRQQVEGYLAHKWGLTSRFSTPLTIPGCAMWLDGADPAGTGTPPVSGTTISTWVDKSGNSNNGTSGTAAFQTDALGGYINFTGSQSYVITNPNIVVNQYFTIFIVEQIGNVSPSQDYVLMKGSTNDNNRNLHIVYRGGSPVIAFAFYFNDLNVNISSYGYGTGNTQPTRLWTFSFIANSRNIYLNGTSIASDNNNTFLASWTGARIGSHPSPSDYYIGKIRELMIYSGTVNTTQRQTIEGYLSQKWGLGVSSTNPSTHPFYRFPPASLPFSPRNISGLQLWLDADDALNFTGSTWNDKSGTNNHAVNGTPGTSSMPTVTTWSNGRRAARFVKESKNSMKTTNSIPIYVTYFIVARVQDVIGATGFGLLMVNNFDGQRQLRTNSTSFPVSVFYFTQTGGTNMVLGSFSQGQGFLFSGTVTSGSAIGYSNGVQIGTSGVNNSTPSRHYFGSGDGDAAYVSADFGEILIYDSILTTSQRQQVEGYLAHKWGLTASLPSTHPYSKFPPP